MPADKITSLSDFTESVCKIREFWNVPNHKELWFRGEDEKYTTILRPKLYRPTKKRSMKPVPELLKIENELYDDFQRCGFQLSDKIEDEDWDWYCLMQHHGAPTRLLDWSDGALMALHFALWPRDMDKAQHNANDAFVYVLEPQRLQDQVKALPEIEVTKQQWKVYAEKHPSEQFSEEEWERAYLPADEEDLNELKIPNVPLLLKFPHITRRVAAQRSRLMVFGTDPSWLSDEFVKPDSAIKVITIEATSIPTIRIELRESGITESVIFPDLDGLGREMAQLWEDRKSVSYTHLTLPTICSV